jgi:alpha-glucosidase (family GH31 glycosyl hydrolase)
MSSRITRRRALRQIGIASAGIIVAPSIIRGQNSPIVVAGKPVEIAIASISPATVRLTVSPTAGGGTVPDVGALVAAANGTAIGRRRESFAPVRAGNLSVRFTPTPPTLHVETLKGELVQRLTLNAESAAVAFALGTGPLLGMGEGGPQFDRKGQIYNNRNGQGGYQLRTHGGRVPIQWLVGTGGLDSRSAQREGGWGMFINHPTGSFDLSGPEGKLLPSDESLPIDVFITASSDPKVIIGEYARITGFAELPPLWSFGYMQSHRTLSGPDEIKWVADTFREKKLPCDALIYLGTEFTPSGWNTRNGEFGWKADNFPNPQSAIDEMHAKHFKVVLHIVIEGRHMTGAVAEPCTPEKAVPSGRTSDDKWPEERPVACYWPYHKPLYDLGVDGMWPDQGDGLDAPSRLARIRMYWEGPQQYRPNQRPFALHRNGSPGMQRYGAFLWSGDVYSLWETLKTHVPVAINTGLSGIPFWGTDIGGFVPTADYTGELHVRWFQFGAFCPLFRAHGRNWYQRLPWGWNIGKQGPAELRGYTNGAADPDPNELHNAGVEPIVKKYLELRYRMLPYIYTVARETVDTGLPMMRALWLHHPDDPAAVARGDQYLWGRDILVSPVVEKGATSRRLYLPRGAWFDFWTEERLEGGREIDRKVDLETMPLHVRAGAILPMGPVKQYVDEPVDGPLAVTVYPGANGSFTLYEDDGKSFEHRKGAWTRIAMAWTDSTRRLTIATAPGSRVPAARDLEVRVAGASSTRRVRFEGKPVEITLPA